MWINQAQQTVGDNEPYTAPDGTNYPYNFPKNEIPGLTKLPEVQPPEPTPQELADALVAAKVAKNEGINRWRAQANNTSFTHSGKQVACDALSRSDIDAVAGSISLSGVFPAGFPGAWKAMDNSYIMLPDVAAFKALYASMTAQGSINFGKSQTLKTQLAACTTVEQVDALVWS